MSHKCKSNVQTLKRCVLTTYSNLEIRYRTFSKSISWRGSFQKLSS